MRVLPDVVMAVINQHREKLDLLGHGSVYFSKTHKFGIGQWKDKYFFKHGEKGITVAEMQTEFYDTEEELAQRLNELLTSL